MARKQNEGNKNLVALISFFFLPWTRTQTNKRPSCGAINFRKVPIVANLALRLVSGGFSKLVGHHYIPTTWMHFVIASKKCPLIFQSAQVV